MSAIVDEELRYANLQTFLEDNDRHKDIKGMSVFNSTTSFGQELLNLCIKLLGCGISRVFLYLKF
jgi:hypothetical protein